MKKARDFTIGEPWSSAQRALEAYNREMREAPVHDCARICNKHGPLMAGICKKLPKNVTPRIFEGGSTTAEPHSAPELAQVPLRHLHRATLTEIELAPTELRETVAQFAAILGAELAVCELAELLDESSDPSASFIEELAVADSMERINTHYHHLVEVIRGFTAELTRTYPELTSLANHARFLRNAGQIAARASGYMRNKLTDEDPLMSAAARLRHSGEALEKAATECEVETEAHVRFWQNLLGGSKAQNPPDRLGLNRKSIIGLLSTLSYSGHGKVNLLVPSEAKRRRRVDVKLSRRRMRGGDDSEEEDLSDIKAVEKAEAAYNQCTKCGNVFREDSVFCRRCGTKRPESPHAAKKAAMQKGPPALKNIFTEEAIDDEETDRAFLDKLRRKNEDQGEHDVWGASALQPSSREIAAQLRQTEQVNDVSDDEQTGKVNIAGDDLTVVARPNKR